MKKRCMFLWISLLLALLLPPMQVRTQEAAPEEIHKENYPTEENGDDREDEKPEETYGDDRKAVRPKETDGDDRRDGRPEDTDGNDRETEKRDEHEETGRTEDKDHEHEEENVPAPQLRVFYHEISRKSLAASPGNMGMKISAVSQEEIRPESELFIREDTEVTVRLKTAAFDPDRMNLHIYKEDYEQKARTDVTSLYYRKRGWRKGAGDTWYLTLLFNEEGHYQLEIGYTDLLGQSLVPSGEEQKGCFGGGIYRGPHYTLDKQDPVIESITTEAVPRKTVNGLPCFDEAPEYEIVIAEENFHPDNFRFTGAGEGIRPGLWETFCQGGVRKNKMRFTPEAEGRYEIRCETGDGSGRKGGGVVAFLVDRSLPRLNLSLADSSRIFRYPYDKVEIFSPDRIMFTARASDDVSGIASIRYTYRNREGKVTEVVKENREEGDYEIGISLDRDDFCGRITAVCTDQMGYESEAVESPVFLWESPERARAENRMNLVYPEAAYTDQTHKIKYYREAPGLTLFCRNSYAGIRDSYIKTVYRGKEREEKKEYHHKKKISYEKKQSILLDPSDYATSQGTDPVEILCGFTDNAGYRTGEVRGDYKVVVDNLFPEVSLHFTDEGESAYYPGPRSAVVTVTDRNFRPSAVRWDISGDKGGYTIGSWQGKGDRHWCTLSFNQDGSYRVGLTVTDYAGNTTDYRQSRPFVIDQTAPSLILWMDRAEAKNGSYYRKAQKVYLLVRDENVPGSGIHLYDGKGGRLKAAPEDQLPSPYLKDARKRGWDIWSFTAEEERTYRISASCRDLAGNLSGKVSLAPFVVDKTPPEVSFPGALSGITYTGEVTPEIRIWDRNMDRSQCQASLCYTDMTAAEKAGQYMFRDDSGEGTVRFYWKDLPREKKYDNRYLLRVSACDLAGNHSPVRELSFCVDRFGSRFVLPEDTLARLEKYYGNREREISFTVYSLHPLLTEVTVTRDQEEYFSLDEKELKIEEKRLTGSEEGEGGGVLPAVFKGWYRTRCRIPEEVFAQEGDYHVTLRSREKDPRNPGDYLTESGNELWTVPLNFTVDKTPPSVRIGGLDKDNYAVDQKAYTVTAMDNTLLKRVKIYIRRKEGEQVIFLNGKDFQENHSINGYLSSWPGEQVIGYEAWDYAGNRISARENGREKKVLVMKPSIGRTWYIHREKIAAILLILCLSGLLLFILTRKKISVIMIKQKTDRQNKKE